MCAKNKTVKNLHEKTITKKVMKIFQICENFLLLGESCKYFENPGKNYQYQNSVGTRCAKNSLRSETLPQLQNWT